ncbi:MAG TPA: hypothetical protein VK149_01505 [Sideroxyarcus sp.]|nr:hypothetical protein [Sideroxyarcus sp.]
MQYTKVFRWIGIIIAIAAVVGCGGGGNGSGVSPIPASVPAPLDNPPIDQPIDPSLNYVRFQSDAGDYIGQGNTYTYTSDSTTIEVAGIGNLISVTIRGEKDWHGDFQVKNSMSKVEPGSYPNLQRYPFNEPAQGGLTWHGAGRGCNTLVGSFTVGKVTYINSTLASIDFSFEQHCEGSTPALHGEVHWVGDPATLPVGETPVGAWQPPMGIAPQAINYVYLNSDTDDWIGSGWEYGYTQATSNISVTANGQILSVVVDGDEKWNGRFQLMGTAGQLQAGDAGNMGWQPLVFDSHWSGEGRACTNTTSRGWFIVDKATYVNGALTEVDLRFEQLCDSMNHALHGAIHWSSADTTIPGGAVNPPPVGLWQPLAGTTPASGNFAYFASDAGDFVGQGQNYLYTQENAVISVAASGGELTLGINGDLPWSGTIATMNFVSQLQPGYYADLRRYPFHNPVKGGLSWGGGGRGCNQLYGWFVIDSVTYANGVLTDIDLRFEQHCEGAIPALHGAIHWSSSDTTMPPGPVNPPPTGLWQPPAGDIPATGSYIYFQSDVGNYVGQGQTYLYTPATATVTPTVTGGRVYLDILGGNHWSGALQAMDFLSQLQPGYYTVVDVPYRNPVRGTLGWDVDSFGCGSVSSGWFVVDSVTYVNGSLTALDARFEQLCQWEVAPLHGAIHWVF